MMTENELKAMTVLELRKHAKESGIVLGAGIDKAGIIRRILDNTTESSPDPVPESGQFESEPKFQAAWHNVDAPRYSARPSYQAPAAAVRPSWQSAPSSAPQPYSRETQRVQPVRPGTFTPRFGPGPSDRRIRRIYSSCIRILYSFVCVTCPSAGCACSSFSAGSRG